MKNIYHYTSIETLALILKNRTIKFNSLKNMDDLNEVEFSNGKNINLSPNVLVSCWTKSGDENLAFWNMYSSDMKGVRISLPSSMFQTYSFVTKGKYVRKNTLIRNSLVSESKCFSDEYWIFNLTNYLVEIQYTDDESLLMPKLYHEGEGRFNLEIGKIGLYKSKIWEFQEEVRFRIFVLPTIDSDNKHINPMNDMYRIIKEQIPPPEESYFLPIKESVFKNMEITLGPKCDMSHKAIVEALVDKYNPGAEVKKNKYQGKIR